MNHTPFEGFFFLDQPLITVQTIEKHGVKRSEFAITQMRTTCN